MSTDLRSFLNEIRRDNQANVAGWVASVPTSPRTYNNAGSVVTITVISLLILVGEVALLRDWATSNPWLLVFAFTDVGFKALLDFVVAFTPLLVVANIAVGGFLGLVFAEKGDDAFRYEPELDVLWKIVLGATVLATVLPAVFVLINLAIMVAVVILALILFGLIANAIE